MPKSSGSSNRWPSRPNQPSSLRMPPVSPLAPTSFPALPEIAGVRLAAAAAGLRYIGRTDVLLAVLDKGTTAAGVLTQSRCPSAPVEWCRARLSAGSARGLVVNSGNANAFTGKSGRAAVNPPAELAPRAIACRPGKTSPGSPGVIGEPLPAQKFAGVMDELA